jgi:hypothetical protein
VLGVDADADRELGAIGVGEALQADRGAALPVGGGDGLALAEAAVGRAIGPSPGLHDLLLVTAEVRHGWLGLLDKPVAVPWWNNLPLRLTA